MYNVYDGQRQFQFEGELLATSTSQSPHSTRWIEFELYRTVGGQYILSRVGVSNYYHHPSCSIVKRNRIPINPDAQVDGLTACEQCSSMLARDHSAGVCPEQPRYWAQVSSEAAGVVDSLQKYDDNGSRYLTNVARRLLVDAARRDSAILDAFSVERVD